MDALAALYPSAAGGSGATISPLAEPVAAPALAVAPAAQVTAALAAAPAPTTQAHERKFTYLSDTPDPDDPSRYLPLADQDAVEHEDAEPVEDAEPIEAVAYIEPREKIARALADVRETEPPAGSVIDYNAVTNYPKSGVEPDTGERDQALAAFQKAGLGTTAVSAIWQAGMDALKTPVTTNTAGAMQALTEAYGEHADARLAEAKAYIATIEKSWPTVKQFLNKSGLGNDPAFIKFVVEHARK